jgi:SAM-dependent methyltransferase
VNVKAVLVSETNPAVEDLRKRLDQFYRTTDDYQAFQDRSWHPNLWSLIVKDITHLNGGTARVLEIGAGRSGFYEYLRQCRVDAHFTAQDVTPKNDCYLRENADEVVIGPLQRVTGIFDIIFSTFVLEHVTDPVATLERCWSLLKPGGTLFIFCPRYDAPFYLSHSADHYAGIVRAAIALRLAAARARTLLTQLPRFFIHTDPALFVLPWQRDRDAVHWVSYFDLAIFFRRRGCLRKIRIPSGGLKDAIVKNLLQINIAVQKPKDRVA